MHTAQTRTADRFESRMIARAAGLAFLSLAACGAEEGDDGAYVSAQVSASGTGCPEGSYEARVGPDGEVALSFDDYEVTVGEGAAEVTKECQISVKLSAKTGVSYAVSKYAHHGHATLEKGVDGKQSSSYYFPNARSVGRLRNSFIEFLPSFLQLA